MDELFKTLADKIEQSNKPYDLAAIEKAYEMAKRAHEGQMRSSGDPYITHPVATAIILVELGMDTATIQAALLHDVVEDTPVTLEMIKKEFGEEVMHLVDGVTKLGRVPFTSRERQQAENVRKMLLAMAQDVRVIIIKLADRLHNMRTIEYRTPEKQRIKSLECMEIYAPLAHRLGISGIKEELEDISIKYLDPVAYEEIEKQLALRKDEREAFLQRVIKQIKDRLAQEHIEASVEGRVKSIYGIYRKVYTQGRSMDEIYDVYAVRIIVDTVSECYNILGIIHDMLRPIPNRFKDYIATPKQNMYQSLHTTVIGKDGPPFEVQIRTWEMHYTAEYGVAAHWKYKIGLAGKEDDMEKRLAWVRQLLESQKESDDVEDIVKSIKSDIAPEEVFVFTPRGDVINLPVGSTVIDFAYAIHSAVGNKMVGAKVDGRIVPLDFKVKTGMIVEVITSPGAGNGPSRDWLNIVRTSEARNKIRAWFKKERREENVAEGRTALEKEFRRNYINPPEESREKFLTQLAARQKYNSVDDFYAAIGYGGVSLQKIMPRVKDEFTRQFRTVQPETPINANMPKAKLSGENKTSSSVVVEGLEGCLVKFARCCNPVPGEPIIGFITRGYGVSVHRRDCVNVVNAINDPQQSDRWVNVSWASRQGEMFKATIELICTDHNGLLADISTALSVMKVPIHSLIARELKGGESNIQITIGIRDTDEQTMVTNNLAKIPGVISIRKAVL